MSTLAPRIAAKLADGVYGIETIAPGNVTGAAIREGIASREVSGLNDFFDIGQAALAHGSSGLGPVSARSGFALVIPGKGSLQGEVAIVCRGTSSGYDWLSNLNVLVDGGPAGLSVHAGFHNVFKSIEGQIDAALKGRNPSRVHCVGHSLGGALANLVAAKMVGKGHGVSLYTFGSPRVGLRGFADFLDNEVGTNDIHRVFNPADVVPMVPIHPFLHSPARREGMRVGAGALFSLEAHYMSSYGPLVENASWSGLAASAGAVPLHQRVDDFLDMASTLVKIPGSSLGCWALGHALKGLIELAEAVTAIQFIVSATVVDCVAAMLLKAARIAQAIGEKLLEWVKLALKYLGIAAVKTVNSTSEITVAFLRWILELLARPILLLARRAIEGANQ